MPFGLANAPAMLLLSDAALISRCLLGEHTTLHYLQTPHTSPHPEDAAGIDQRLRVRVRWSPTHAGSIRTAAISQAGRPRWGPNLWGIVEEPTGPAEIAKVAEVAGPAVAAGRKGIFTTADCFFWRGWAWGRLFFFLEEERKTTSSLDGGESVTGDSISDKHWRILRFDKIIFDAKRLSSNILSPLVGFKVIKIH